MSTKNEYTIQIITDDFRIYFSKLVENQFRSMEDDGTTLRAHGAFWEIEFLNTGVLQENYRLSIYISNNAKAGKLLRLYELFNID